MTTPAQLYQIPGILLYTRIAKSPFFYASWRHKPKLYSVYNHRYHPRLYGDPEEEYWALVNDVTLWDVGVEVQVQVTGPDAFDFVNWVITRDLSKCKVGQCKYVFLTDENGGIINDPVLLRLQENEFWFSLADSDVHLWLKGLAYGSRFNVTIREIDVAPVQVQGPKAKEVMRELFGEAVLGLPYYHLMEATLDGMQVVISRTGYSGEIGYEIYLRDASRHAIALWDRVYEAGQPYGLKVIGPCHTRRIEAGILAYGADIDITTNPFEVGMGYEWMVSLKKESDFIGKEALQRIKGEGIKRLLVGIEIEGESLGYYNDGSMIDFFPVYLPNGAEQVGKVTSACYSPRLQKNIGYAMVPIELSAIGTELEVQTPYGRRRAQVVPKPFVDPKKDIPKQ
jgi:glycine cleavage system T protein